MFFLLRKVLFGFSEGAPPVGCRRVHSHRFSHEFPEDPPILPIDSAIEPKMEPFLSAADAILDAVAHAQIASVSYVSNPFVGVADLHLLSKDVLPRIGPGDEEAIAAIAEPSLRELSRARKLLVVDVSSTRLQLEWEYSGAVLAELLRADLDGDGAEEILIQYYTHAVGGTLGYGSIGLLRRPEPGSMFEYVADWR